MGEVTQRPQSNGLEEIIQQNTGVMRLQSKCKLDNALSGLEIIEFLVRKSQSVFGGHVHMRQ